MKTPTRKTTEREPVPASRDHGRTFEVVGVSSEREGRGYLPSFSLELEPARVMQPDEPGITRISVRGRAGDALPAVGSRVRLSFVEAA